MSTGLEGRLYLLAFDHRESFQEGLFGIHGTPSADQAARIRHSKERVGGSRDRYDTEIRPDLVVRTIAEAQTAGVEPDIWKVEGLERREDCVRVVQAARAGGGDRLACIVLGRGASEERVVEWLRQAAGVEGFKGFAIGRTIRVGRPGQVAGRRAGSRRHVGADRGQVPADGRRLRRRGRGVPSPPTEQGEKYERCEPPARSRAEPLARQHYPPAARRGRPGPVRRGRVGHGPHLQSDHLRPRDRRQR